MSALLAFFVFVAAAPAAELWLGVGEVRPLPAAPGVAIKVGARGVVRVIDGPRAVQIVALKPGRVTVVIGTQVVHVRVVAAGQRAFGRALIDTVSGLRGLSVEWTGDRPEVTGTLLRFSDWRLIAEVARRYGGAYVFRARVLRDVGERAVRHFREFAEARGYPSPRFGAQPDFVIILPGGAGPLRAQVERGFGAFGLRVDVDAEELSVRPLVRTHLVLAEVSRGFGRTLGVRWPDQYQARVLPQVDADRDLLANLRAMEARGQAQVLASPDLSCRSGGQARFLAGGELPIRTATRQRQGVEWKSFGVSLEVRPHADVRGNLSLAVKTEISLVDFAHAVDGIPALKKNVVESQFDLPGRRTVALSGLIRRELGESTEGLPVLGRIPLLGRLFSSHQFQRHQSELVVFVTPEVVTAGADEPVRLPEGWVSDE